MLLLGGGGGERERERGTHYPDWFMHPLRKRVKGYRERGTHYPDLIRHLSPRESIVTEREGERGEVNGIEGVKG